MSARLAIGGALVLVAAWAAPAVALAQDSTRTFARVSGVVFDSVANRVVSGATVQLVSTADPTMSVSRTTGASGAYQFDSVSVGDYVIGFLHAALDSLSLNSPLVRVRVRSGGDIRVPLAVPSARTIIQAVCKNDVARDSTGLLLGFVRHIADAQLTSEGLVRVQWSEITIGQQGVQRTTPEINARSTPGAGYAACGIPVGTSVLLRGWARQDSSGFIELPVPEAGLVRRDILVGRAIPRAVAAASDTADTAGISVEVVRGDGALRGTVRRSNGSPVEGARLLVWGTGIEVTTNVNGTYAIDGLPTGSHTLEARALGFLPVRRPVDILPGGASADIVLETLAAVLDTIKVRAQSVWKSPQMRDFEQRKKAGFGYFMDEDAIERRNPMFVADLFQMAPGVQIVPGQGFGYRILMRGRSFSPSCVPAFFLDGVRMVGGDGNLDQFLNPTDVRAVEVYTRASNVPPQFNTMDGCGSIVIWTGGRRPRAEREGERR